VAKSSVELIHELTTEVRLLNSRNGWLVTQLSDQKSDQKAADLQRQAEIAELRKENADLRLELAAARADAHREIDLLKQQLQEVVKKADLADSRRWSLLLALFGTVLTLAAGLVLALVRK